MINLNFDCWWYKRFLAEYLHHFLYHIRTTHKNIKYKFIVCCINNHQISASVCLPSKSRALSLPRVQSLICLQQTRLSSETELMMMTVMKVMAMMTMMMKKKSVTEVSS